MNLVISRSRSSDVGLHPVMPLSVIQVVGVASGDSWSFAFTSFAAAFRALGSMARSWRPWLYALLSCLAIAQEVEKAQAHGVHAREPRHCLGSLR